MVTGDQPQVCYFERSVRATPTTIGSSGVVRPNISAAKDGSISP